MAGHPDVWLYPQTDTAYFVEEELVGRTTWLDGPVDGEGWERTHDPEDYIGRFAGAGDRAAVGEKCADILFWRPSHRRVARFLPHGRFIATLRHPVDRAWSHYWNEVGKGREDLSFEEALDAEDRRADRSDYARYHLSYRRRGHYDESLSSFLEAVERDRVMVVVLEEAMADPVTALRSVYGFLDVDPDRGLEGAGSRHNENWTMVPRRWAGLPGVSRLEGAYRKGAKRVAERVLRSSSERVDERVEKKRRVLHYAEMPFRRPAQTVPMRPETRAMLGAGYAPHVAELERMLGRSLAVWRTGEGP